MKSRNKVLLGIGLTVALLASTAGLWAHTEADPLIALLYAGNPKDMATPVIAGHAEIWNDTAKIYVRYVLDEGWELISSHVAVATTLGGIPHTKSWNPKVGNFKYHGTATQMDLIEVPLRTAWTVGTDLVIAVHGVVQTCDYVADICSVAPNVIGHTIWANKPIQASPESYFQVDLVDETVPPGPLNGNFLAWCIDTDNNIDYYPAYVDAYLPYACPSDPVYPPMPEGLITYPENLDLVNWIINQGFIGTPSPGGFGNYTYGDVQRAIWTLIEDNLIGNGLGAWNQNRVDEILAAAAGHDGFVPDCGQKMVVILNPIFDPILFPGRLAQVIMVELPVPCIPICDSETAWAGVPPTLLSFPGANWALYFNYEVQ